MVDGVQRGRVCGHCRQVGHRILPGGRGRCCCGRRSRFDGHFGHHGGHLGVHVVVARLEHGAPDGSKFVLVALHALGPVGRVVNLARVVGLFLMLEGARNFAVDCRNVLHRLLLHQGGDEACRVPSVPRGGPCSGFGSAAHPRTAPLRCRVCFSGRGSFCMWPFCPPWLPPWPCRACPSTFVPAAAVSPWPDARCLWPESRLFVAHPLEPPDEGAHVGPLGL